jgi:hypothetical protein
MGLNDKAFAKEIISKGYEIESKAVLEEEEIIKMVESAIIKGQ